MESLILLVWRARQEIRLQETRAVVQAVLAAASDESNAKEASDQLQKSWEAYLDELFPYHRGTRKRADQAAMEVFLREMSRGPLTVTPLTPLTKGKSKLYKQKMAAQQEPQAPKYRRRKRGR
jgi:hypothetical protein